MMSNLVNTFDTAVGLYDKRRPDYPAELYDVLFGYAHATPGDRALEIGIGTGQATGPMLAKGLSVHAIELGQKLAAYAAQKYAENKAFTIACGDFMQLPLPMETYDIIYAATSFHWLPEEEAYPRVLSLLKPGGVFARFANHPWPALKEPAMYDAIQDIYAKFRGSRGTQKPFAEAEASRIAALAGKYGFDACEYHLFHRVRVFTAAEYMELLNTYSDHIAMPAEVKIAFENELTNVINAYGGRVNVYDTVDIELAKKPR